MTEILLMIDKFIIHDLIFAMLFKSLVVANTPVSTIIVDDIDFHMGKMLFDLHNQ